MQTGNHIFDGCNFDTNDINNNNFMDKDTTGDDDDNDCHAAVIMVIR